MLSNEAHGRNLAWQVCIKVYNIQSLSPQALPDEEHSDKEDGTSVEPIWCCLLQSIRFGFACGMSNPLPKFLDDQSNLSATFFEISERGTSIHGNH